MQATTNAFPILDEICRFYRPEGRGNRKYRNAVGLPYWRDGHLYATDAAIMARVPCSQEDAVGVYGSAVMRKNKPAHASWNKPDDTTGYTDVEIETAQYQSLTACNCRRFASPLCGECDDGVLPIYRAVRLLGVDPPFWAGAWYFAILARFHVTSLSLPVDSGPERLLLPALFRGNGFEGLLMRMTAGD